MACQRFKAKSSFFETASGHRLALLDGPTVAARRSVAVTLLGIQPLAQNAT
jgi:1-piperideine-2-carboxylate/1-pyrroline-2-carboxylate reductase [NAD(P)H]